MTERITIFGYGPVGRATTARLLAEGREVIVAQRSAPSDLPKGAKFAPTDALDRDAVAKAVRGSGQFVVTIGFPYSGVLWRDVWPRAISNFVAACKATGARMVFMDDLYMYGPQTTPLTETMALSYYGLKPAARSAATRVWMAAAAAGEARVAALRAPDFYGPGVGLSFLGDTSIAKLAQGKPAVFVGSPDVLHDYAYVPDIARATTTLLDAPRLSLWSGLAYAVRANSNDARYPANRSRHARREAAHQRHAGLDAGPKRDVLTLPARTEGDALPVGPTVPGRREPFQSRVLVGRDAIRNRRPGDRVRLSRRIKAEALSALFPWTLKRRTARAGRRGLLI
jgi:nucleoside-diphosphate-sugar epimerase